MAAQCVRQGGELICRCMLLYHLAQQLLMPAGILHQDTRAGLAILLGL